MAGCSSFVSAQEDAPPSVAPETDTTTGAPQGSTTGAGTTGAQGSGGGSGDEAKVDVGDTDTASTSTTEASTGEVADGSSGTTSGGVTTSPFESNYTGFFMTVGCQIDGGGTLAIEVDAEGRITGTATVAFGSVDLTGSVDALGMVNGSVPLPTIGACLLTGSIDEGSLEASGEFDCPGAQCGGLWTLAAVP